MIGIFHAAILAASLAAPSAPAVQKSACCSAAQATCNCGPNCKCGSSCTCSGGCCQSGQCQCGCCAQNGCCSGSASAK